MLRPSPKLRSKPRRGSRFIVWYVLAFVLFARYVWLPELWQMPRQPVPRFQNQAQFQPNGPRQFPRPPVRVNPPVAAVPPELPRLSIEVTEEDMQRLRGYFWNGWNGGGGGQSRPEVNVTVRDRDVVYTNVTLHPKGSAGSFRHIDSKPALTLNFSKNAPGQKFRGFTKLSLNNSVQDSSFLSEAITRELFVKAGVPAPQASHATVILNGRDLGLYVLVEGYGKTFLKRHFKNTHGNLYDGGFCKEVTQDMDVNSGDNPEDKSDLRRLIQSVREQDLTNKWNKLNAVLDMDRFLSFLAMEVMTCHWDGYAMNRNNYRVFHDLESDRMVFMPHGTDQMFGTFRSSPTSSILPSMRGEVARAVMSTPQGRAAYLDRVATLSTNLFLADKITARVREISNGIRPTLAAYGEQENRQHDHEMNLLCQRITERARSITEQLARPKEPAKPTQRPNWYALPDGGRDGQSKPNEPTRTTSQRVASLKNWSPNSTQTEQGGIDFQRTREDNKSLLYIKTSRGAGASWRTRVALESGSYLFEGRARTKGVANNGTVGLRISGIQVASRRIPDGEWVPLQFKIDVTEPLAEVELVCELRAPSGEAWFDEGSLRLIRQ